MCQPPDWSQGDLYLRERVPELAPLVEKYAPCPLKPRNSEEYFTILLSGIIAQQLPPDVSQQLMCKLGKLLGKPITSAALEKADVAALAELGLSAQKITYIKDFAHALVSKTIDLDVIVTKDDSQITKQLLNVRGLGPWTIEMFLLLALCRTDVVPTSDYIFKKTLKQLYNLPDIPKRGQINKLTQSWRPWRSLAVWYMWQYAAEQNKG